MRIIFRKECMRHLFLLVLLTACGQSNNPITPDFSNCAVINKCTHANVPGYVCQPENYLKSNSVYIPAQFFMGKSCLITMQDYEASPGCDPSNPSQVCGGGWGNGGQSHPCCQTIQGPGPAITI